MEGPPLSAIRPLLLDELTAADGHLAGRHREVQLERAGRQGLVHTWKPRPCAPQLWSTQPREASCVKSVTCVACSVLTACALDEQICTDVHAVWTQAMWLPCRVELLQSRPRLDCAMLP